MQLFCALSKWDETKVAAETGSRATTWRDEEGPPQFLIARHISDLPRHVDKPSCHRGHSPEVKDPEARKRQIDNHFYNL